TVSGTAFDSRGRRFPSVSLQIEIHSQGGGSFGGAGSTTVGPDGAFVIHNVPPGDYVLQAAISEPAREVAQLPLVVEGVDLANLVLTGSSGGSIAGSVAAASDATPRLPRIDVSAAEPFVGQPSPAMIGFAQFARATVG